MLVVIIIILLVICIILISSFKKESFKTCSFRAKGDTLSKCVIDCSLNYKDECSTTKCEQKCNSCTDTNSCKWYVPQTCKFNPKGTSIMYCVDECLSPKKYLWGGKECDYGKCKQICDNCRDNKYCTWLNKKKEQCEFLPWGDTKDSCVDRCISDDRNKWGGSKCTDKTCEVICNGCDNSTICKWKSIADDDTDTIIPGVPPAQKIRCMNGDNKIIVQWYVKENKDPITGYILYYFKTFKPFHGIKLIHLNQDKFESKSCQHVIENLEKNEHYSVVLIALNSKGKSRRSNIEELQLNDVSSLTDS